MTILELLCNPRPASFNRALSLRARDRLVGLGHEVLFHDLFEEGFDPVLDSSELARGFSLDPLVQAHFRELTEADGLIVVHPWWWGGPPAQLKGWMDRVLRQGIAYDLEGGEFSEKDWIPLLSGKRAVIFVTSDEDSAAVERPVSDLWAGTVLGKCGMACDCQVMGGLRRSTASTRAQWMADMDSRLTVFSNSLHGAIDHGGG